MKTRMLLVVGAAAAVMLASGLAVGGGDKDGPEKVSIDQIEGKKGAVEFAHKKHAKEYKGPDGAAIKCVTCHHTSKGSEKPASCKSCHVAEGEAQKEHGGKKAPFMATMKGPGKPDMKSIVYHTSCMDNCHKKMAKVDEKYKALGKCDNCHKK